MKTAFGILETALLVASLWLLTGLIGASEGQTDLCSRSVIRVLTAIGR